MAYQPPRQRGFLEPPPGQSGIRGFLGSPGGQTMMGAGLGALDALGAARPHASPVGLGTVLDHVNAGDRQRQAQRMAEEALRIKDIAAQPKALKAQKRWRPLTTAEKAMRPNLDPGKPYQINQYGDVEQIGGSGGVNIDFGERVGFKAVDKLLTEITTDAQAANETERRVRTMQKALASGKLISGSLAEQREWVTSFGDTFLTAKGAELLRSAVQTAGKDLGVTGLFRVNSIRESLGQAQHFKGNLNQEEIKMIQQAVARMSDRPEAAAAILADLAELISDRQAYYQRLIKHGAEFPEDIGGLRVMTTQSPYGLGRGSTTPPPVPTPTPTPTPTPRPVPTISR